MKKVSLAATVALMLMGATTVANANGTVKSQPAATPVAAPATTAATAAPAMASTGGGVNPASAELIARPGNHKNTNFELDIMFPVFQPSCGDRLLAIDIRGMRDVRRNTEGNFGLVYRQIVNNSFVLGGYVYGDVRRTRNKNTFGQATVGVDVLSNMVDARFNGYIAQNKKKAISGTEKTRFIGNAIGTSGQFEVAQSGFDGEIGVRIPMPGMNNIETRVFAGGYRFSKSGTKAMSGPRGRLEVRILDVINPGSRLTLGVDVSNDKVRKTTVNGVVGLRVPMQFVSGGKVPQGLQRRLADYVYRDVNINTFAKEEDRGNMVDPKTGKDYFVIHIKGPGSTTAATTQSGTGTVEDPYAMWDDATSVAKAAANPGTLTFLEGSGFINAPASVITPTNNQAWYGPATKVVLTDNRNGKSLTVQEASSNVITIIGANAQPLFDAGANNPSIRAIAGFTHEPVAGDARLITGTYTANANAQVNIRDIISNPDNTADNEVINLTFNGNQTSKLSVSNVAINGLDGAGAAEAIRVDLTAGANVTVLTDTIKFAGLNTAATLNAVRLVNNQSTLTFMDTNSSYSNAQTAIRIDDDSGAVAQKSTVNFTLTNPTISGMAVQGINLTRTSGGQMSNTAITGTISGAKFTSTAGQDIRVNAGAGATVNSVDLTLVGNQHTNTNSKALLLTQQTAAGNASTVNVTMNNVKMTGTGGNNAVEIAINNAANQANAVTVNMQGVTTSVGYADAIALTGAGALTATANQVRLGMSGGGNSLNATTNTFNGNGFATGAGAAGSAVGVAIVAGNYVFLDNTTMGNSQGALGAQWPKPVVY